MPNPEGGDASQNDGQTIANSQQGAKPAPKRDPVLTARDQLLAKLDEQIVEQRTQDDDTFLRSGDPRAAMLHEQMVRESKGQRIATDKVDDDEAADTYADGGDPYEPEPPTAEVRAAKQVQIDDQGRDPLADYVVQQGGKPMFKTIVNGQVRLIPLDKARIQLQKHLAADIRWEQLSVQERELKARAQQISATEATLRTRQTEATPIDESALEAESVELVRSLVSEPEAVAAKKLSKVLTKIRASAPQVDVTALGRQAASIARQEIAAEGEVKALGNGLQEFTKAYPDIAADSDLFAVADRKTTAIAEEHPEWTPGQVMLEAGKQTREWFGRTAPAAAGDLSNRRQQLKQGLKPMPQQRSARPAGNADANADSSPQDAVAEIRKSRGQAY